MIIRSVLKTVIPIHTGARLISSTSTPLLVDVYDSIREKVQPKREQNDQFELVRSLAKQSVNYGRKAQTMKQTRDNLIKLHYSKDLENYQVRRWKEGDIYSPHDLSPEEMNKWKEGKNVTEDVFDILGINPLHEYKNFSIMSEYMTSMGRIKHREKTGLRRVNQRRLAKAIRRAVGMGLMPSVHKHPEMLEADARAQRNDYARMLKRT